MIELDKNTYKGIVKYTLESMRDLAMEDMSYNLQLDLSHYYESKIKSEKILSIDEFMELCREVQIDFTLN